MKITVNTVCEDGIIFNTEQGPLILTPIEIYDAVHVLRDGLHQWSKLTGKSIYERNPT